MAFFRMIHLPIFAFALAVCGASMAQSGGASQKRAYANFTTAPTFIKVLLRDTRSGVARWMILENPELVFFMAEQRGVSPDQVVAFFREDYLPFMLEQEGHPIEVDMAAFIDWLARGRVGGEQQARAYVEQRTFERPFTLAELGFTQKQDLLNAYFAVNPETGGGRLLSTDEWKGSANPWDPRFLALLIDLGLVPGRGDIVPFLYVHTR